MAYAEHMEPLFCPARLGSIFMIQLLEKRASSLGSPASRSRPEVTQGTGSLFSIHLSGYQTELAEISLDLSRFDAAPSARLSHLPFEGVRAFPTQRRMTASRIVEAIDVFEDRHFSLSPRFP